MASAAARISRVGMLGSRTRTFGPRSTGEVVCRGAAEAGPALASVASSAIRMSLGRHTATSDVASGDGPPNLGRPAADLLSVAAALRRGRDCAARRRDDVPAAAEGLEALARGRARPGVEREAIEGMAGVVDLRAARTPDGREQGRLRAPRGVRAPVGHLRGPVLRAGTRAAALPPLVLEEAVQGAALAVDEEGPERARARLDDRALR